MAKLILYACPVGPLAQQIAQYFQQSQQQCGKNLAHAYMPHCTLTGFFEDQESAIPIYVAAVREAWATYREQIPTPPIEIQGLSFRPDWHGLVLQADWLKQMVVCFSQSANSPTRLEALRLKDWLHLSLAYGFQPMHEERLKALAQSIVDVSAAVKWDVRFYGRSSKNVWTCYDTVPLYSE